MAPAGHLARLAATAEPVTAEPPGPWPDEPASRPPTRGYGRPPFPRAAPTHAGSAPRFGLSLVLVLVASTS